MNMSGNYKKQSRPFNPKPPRQAETAQPQTDQEPEEEAKWNPTPEVFEAFLVRDQQLAAGNVRAVLSTANGPANLKYLKDSTLHSSECIERVIAEGVAAGTIVESKGRYSLAPRTVR